ncbi:MAG: hypothetical protein VX589_20550 [Myxococcota bacterium]|nr:hypothetical protein [Myxococcota bacterium]
MKKSVGCGAWIIVFSLGCGDTDSTAGDPLDQPNLSGQIMEPGLVTSMDMEVQMDMDMMIRALDAQPSAPDAAVPDAAQPVVDGSEADCANDRDCDDEIFCNGRERCSAGRCYASPTPPCTDGISCTDDVCDEDADTCTNALDNTACPDAHLCDRKLGCLPIIPCTTSEECDDGSACNGLEVCRDNRCLRGEPVICDDAVACTEDVCVDGPDGASSCEHLPVHGRCVGLELCSTETGCGEPASCARDDDCDDASYCNGTETCNIALAVCVPGQPPQVDDNIPCTIDVCSDARAMVLHRPAPARCSDGQFCNGVETCDPIVGCTAGRPPALGDGVSCTIDECDEAADIVRHVPNDRACDDRLFCNGREVCDALEDCQPGEPPQVNDGLECTIDSCNEVDDRIEHRPTDALCDDGLFCNGREICDLETDCRAGAPPTLDDGHACTVDTCNEETDTIEHRPDSTRCDDGLFCNGVERCDADAGCQPGQPPSLDDGISCTRDTCDDVQNRVIHRPDNGLCDDNLFCNGVEICNPTLDCQSGAPPRLSDGIDCTIDTCNEVNDRVEHRPSDAVCNDSLFCNGRETCSAVNGCQAGTPPVLDDTQPCTIDTCNEDTDTIEHRPDDTRCDDGLFCNGVEQCDANAGCRMGVPPGRDDGISCTIDTCNEGTDTIEHRPDDTRCDDGLFCNGVEQCDRQFDCQSGQELDLDDGVDCTEDLCDEVNDRIVHQTNDNLCDNGLFCDGAETCDANDDCQPGIPPTLNDRVGCTIDTCDEAADTVTHTPDDGACIDANLCNGREFCDVQQGCLNDQAPPPGTVCQPNPRSICIANKCTESRCGDGYMDVDMGEACDDGNTMNGDNCSSECQIEGQGNGSDETNYTGCYEVTPAVSYQCQEIFFNTDVANVQATRLDFSRLVGQLLVQRGVPLRGMEPQPADMIQRPAPNDGTFDVSGVIPGDCDETYRLRGQFSDPERNRWTGTLTVGFNGLTCGLTNCAFQRIELVGNRIDCTGN